MNTSIGPTGPTGAPSFAAVGSFGVPTGPMSAAPFAAVGSFVGPTGLTAAASGSGGAYAVPVAQIEAGVLTDNADLPELTSVPRGAELILCIFVRPKHQKEQLARYEERFTDWSRKFGARTARRLYWLHAFQSIFDMLKIGVIGDLLDRIYDWFSGKP